MIEVVYNEEKKKAVGNESFFHIPKNIRQIGETDPHFKIYIEDYAYHYLDRIADKISGGRVALLLGQTNWAEGIAYIFIKSAFCLKNMEVDANHIPFGAEAWKEAGEAMESRFPGQKVVGWCYMGPEMELELTGAMYRAHMNHFAGNDKVLLLMEPVDGEEAFFRYAGGKICRQRGYYLYYERNDAMQSFMIEENCNQPMEHKGEVPDRAVKDFREIIAQKKEPAKEEKRKEGPAPYLMYATAAAAVVLALAFGVNALENYGKIGKTPEVMSELEASAEAADVRAKEEGDFWASQEKIHREEMESEHDLKEDRQKETAEEKMPVKENKVDSAVKSVGSLRGGRTYVVRQGDTLTSISRDAYGNIDMIGRICEENGMTEESVIYPGEKILLP